MEAKYWNLFFILKKKQTTPNLSNAYYVSGIVLLGKHYSKQNWPIPTLVGLEFKREDRHQWVNTGISV